MKKISFLAAMLMLLGISFTSCKEDTQPRLSEPTEFVLNTPAMANQLYIISSTSTIDFTVSQANYGLATTPTYQIQLSDTEDFEKYETVEFSTTSAKISVPGEAFSIAACTLFGYSSKTECENNPRTIYVRAISSIANASDAYTITSNVIKLAQVQPYFAIKLPDVIYLVGQPQGWKWADADESAKFAMPVPETEIGSKIYQATYYINAGDFQFRFYDEYSDDKPWDWYSIGAQDEDNPVEISFTNGVYSGPCFYDPNTSAAGKGSWQCSSWAGGNLKMTVNLNDLKVSFEIVE